MICQFNATTVCYTNSLLCNSRLFSNAHVDTYIYAYTFIDLVTMCEMFILARAQKEHHEKKEKAKLARTQIDFVGASAAKRPVTAPTTNTGRIAPNIY